MEYFLKRDQVRCFFFVRFVASYESDVMRSSRKRRRSEKDAESMDVSRRSK